MAAARTIAIAPISLMTTAVSANAGSVKARRSSVVLPLPRKPVSTVIGMLSRAGEGGTAGLTSLFRHDRFMRRPRRQVWRQSANRP